MSEYHDYLVDGIRLGPRRELNLSLRDPSHRSIGVLRFSAIDDYASVEAWYQSNAEELEAANAGEYYIRIEQITSRKLRGRQFDYEIQLDHIDTLRLQGRKAQVIGP